MVHADLVVKAVAERMELFTKVSHMKHLNVAQEYLSFSRLNV